MSARLVAVQMELLIALEQYVEDNKPLRRVRSPGNFPSHYYAPPISPPPSSSTQGSSSKASFQGLSDEDLVNLLADIYDDADRRMLQATWTVLCGPKPGFETIPVPFLPTCPLFSITRQQVWRWGVGG